MLKSLCVFCGSAFGNKPEYRQAAIEMGQVLASHGITLVYGGGNVGLMGTIADAVLAAGGKAIGVLPDFLRVRELGHPGLTELIIVDSMHTRKAKMAELSDGFIAMPGGFGTFEEFCEVLTWSQLGLHQKPHGLLNVSGYYDPLSHMFDSAMEEGFLRPPHRDLVLIDASPAALMEKMQAFQPNVAAIKWIDRGEKT